MLVLNAVLVRLLSSVSPVLSNAVADETELSYLFCWPERQTLVYNHTGFKPTCVSWFGEPFKLLAGGLRRLSAGNSDSAR